MVFISSLRPLVFREHLGIKNSGDMCWAGEGSQEKDYVKYVNIM